MLVIFPGMKLLVQRPGSVMAVSRGEIFVEIAGDVRYPGVYSFHDCPDLSNLIDTSGGYESDDSLSSKSRHFPLVSGSKVVVRSGGEPYEEVLSEMSAFFKVTLGVPVPLNRESEEGLTAVPGIGPALARAIARERSARGGFTRMDELLSIHGISHALYGRIKPYLTL